MEVKGECAMPRSRRCIARAKKRNEAKHRTSEGPVHIWLYHQRDDVKQLKY